MRLTDGYSVGRRKKDMRECWNWQTGRLEVPVSHLQACGFKSHLSHHAAGHNARRRIFCLRARVAEQG